MNLLELAKLKGEKSISDMSTEELIAHLRETRERRRTPLPKEATVVRVATKKSDKTLSKKIKDAQDISKLASEMTQEQMMELLAKLGG